MDGFDDIEDVVLVGGVMTISVFIIKSPERWHDWSTEGFELVKRSLVLSTPPRLLDVHQIEVWRTNRSPKPSGSTNTSS